VADEDDRTVHRRHDPLRGLDVVDEGDRRILDDADVEAILPQGAEDAIPAGTVDKATMDENDVVGR
jgi:hypothetical protein